MVVVASLLHVSAEVPKDVVACCARTEVPCCAMGVPQCEAAAVLGCPLRLALPTTESGMGAALSCRERSSNLPFPGSASPLWSSHYCYWENFPPHFRYLHFAIICILAQFEFFFLSKLELLLWQEHGQQAVLTSQENAVTTLQTSASAKEDFLLPWLKTAWIFSFVLQ